MNILALDDEKLALSSLKREIHEVFPNDEIICCQNIDDVIEIVKETKNNNQTIDYAFCDIELPQINGVQIAGMLKRYFPKVKILFTTAYSQYALDAFKIKAKGYLLKPIRAKDIIEVLDEMVEDWKDQKAQLKQNIRIQTFGDFEVFVDDKPMHFERSKSKELFAYLVDRKGAGVTTERLAAILFEEDCYDKKVRNNVTRIVSFLRQDLKKAGIEDILIKSWNSLAIDPNKIKCDAYDYEKGDLLAINSYRGEYMYGYEWAEFSSGFIENDKKIKK